MSDILAKNDCIFVAGARGLVGSSIVRTLHAKGFKNILVPTHTELDLMDAETVKLFFKRHQPRYVFLAAAKVGGIYANNTYPADFIFNNLSIQNNVIHESWRQDVKRLIFLGSSCVYPRDCPQPIKEEYLMTGDLERTNRPYAIAKIAGIELCWAYNRQYGTQFLSAMPTNTYGSLDNFHLENSHVMPALIRKMHEAKIENRSEVEIWGTGKPRREFLYVDDLAEACLFLMSLPEDQYVNLLKKQMGPWVNIGCGEDLTIAELAELVAEVVGYSGKFCWNVNQPDGTLRKLLDVSLLASLGWKPQVNLKDGIQKAYAAYLAALG
ncbi:MAG: GDP-fucose synthetase [Gammaproteobacteria bacterium GWF2_41_13]|nr:MAG: GDP-fucose synthetase [Gammaproteobacteria bacterium GWF2_41_13]